MSVYNDVIFKDFNLTPRAKQAYKDAYDIAKELDHKNINNLHVLYGCIKNSSSHLKSFLLSNGVLIKDEDMIDVILKAKEENNDKFFANDNSDLWHQEVTEAIKAANDVSNDLNQYYVGIEHVILGIINTSTYVFKSIDDFIINFKSFKSKLNDFLVEDIENPEDLDHSFEDLIENFSDIDLSNEEGQSILAEESNMPDFITNLSQLYVDGKLPDIYGREKEINLLIETISKKNKCNAILTGEAGVGKTAIVEFLARKICQADVPTNLLGMEILSVDLGTMLAGTQYRGQFEQKLKSLLDVAKRNPHIILFFDEVHTIFGAGGNQEGGVDAANMLKPLLARGEIKCIGSTTNAEYDKIFKKDSAMKRRFFNIEVDEPSKEETKKILYNCKSKYEEFHHVKFSKPIVDSIVDLSHSLISHKKFPDKAFDIIDQVGSRVKIRNLKPCGKILKSHDDLVDIISKGGDVEVEDIKDKFNKFVEELKTVNDECMANPVNIKKQDILEVISEHGKVSIEQIKNSRQGFSSFLPRMLSEVFGQDQVLKKINDLLSCAKAGLTDEDKPLASMFFVGPTSVGKTYTAKKIAKNFFGNEKAMLQINMSELYDKTGMSKLIGANSGYVGYEEGGLLTKFVRDNPNCVVLFDEVEKADPQVLNLLLHLLDEGYIEDNRHEKVDFSKAVVILTSNIGHAEANKKSMGFVQSESARSDSYNESVKKKLKPELLARINEVMVFDDLSDSDLKRIISFELNKIKDKLIKKGINIKFNKSSIDCVFDRIKQSGLHARDIKNYIREKIQVPVAKIVVKNSKTSEISIKSVDNRIKVC